MSVKTPSAVVSFYNVPEDAADPIIKVFVNNVEKTLGGDGVEIIKVNIEDSTDPSTYYMCKLGKTYNEMVSIIENKPVYISYKWNVDENTQQDAMIPIITVGKFQGLDGTMYGAQPAGDNSGDPGDIFFSASDPDAELVAYWGER